MLLRDDKRRVESYHLQSGRSCEQPRLQSEPRSLSKGSSRCFQLYLPACPEPGGWDWGKIKWAALTFSPLDPGSPLRPGRPGGPWTTTAQVTNQFCCKKKRQPEWEEGNILRPGEGGCNNKHERDRRARDKRERERCENDALQWKKQENHYTTKETSLDNNWKPHTYMTWGGKLITNTLATCYTVLNIHAQMDYAY